MNHRVSIHFIFVENLHSFFVAFDMSGFDTKDIHTHSITRFENTIINRKAEYIQYIHTMREKLKLSNSNK